MKTLRQAAVLAILAGTLTGCGSRPALKDRGTGSPLAERPTTPLPVDDLEGPRQKPEYTVGQPPKAAKPALSPGKAAPEPVGREAAIGLEGEPEVPAGKPAVTQPKVQPNQPKPTREAAVPLDEQPAKQPNKPEAAIPSAQQPEKQPETRPVVKTKAATLEELREAAVSVVLKAAASEDPTLRANAIESAGLAPRRLSQAITAGLTDRNEGVQAVALMSIGRYKLSDFVPRVKPLLDSTSPYVSSAAVMAMARCGEKVSDERMTKLAELLWTSTSPKIRAHVAYVLGEIGNASALPMLRQAAALKMPSATSIESNIMLLQFSEALFKLGDAEQIDSIRAALYPATPDDLEATAVAAQILGELRDGKPRDQMVVLTTAKDSNGQSYPAEVRMAMAGALAKLGLDRGGFIADEFANSPDVLLRTQAAGVYGDTGRREHLSKLAVLIDDPEEIVRISAASAVLKIANKAESGR